MYGPTHRQRDQVGLIRCHKATHRVPPSFEDVADGMVLASTSGVTRLIDGLEERGVVRRLPAAARSMERVANDAIRVTFSSGERAAIASRAKARGMTVEQFVAYSARVIAGVPR
jgi:SOS-response transcriptional repressor LexA